MLHGRKADESGPLPQFQVELSDADRTLEYRARRKPGPDDRLATQMPSLVAEVLDRARTLAPVTIREVRSADRTEDIDIDVAALSPDASLQFPHPVDPTLFADDSSEIFEPTRKMRALRRDPRLMIAAFGAIVTAAAIVLGLGLAHRPTPAPVVVEPSAPAAPIASAPAAVEAPPPPPALPTTGTITTPTWAKGRRVFVDGKMAGESPRLEIACGTHRVRVGTAGRTRSVDVPCGGSVLVTP